MKLNRIHAIIGLLLVLVPFMGFTREFKYGFSVLAGAVLLYFALISIHTELKKKQHRRPHRHDTFVESKPATQPIQEVIIEGMKDSLDDTKSPPIPSTSHIADSEPKV